MRAVETRPPSSSRRRAAAPPQRPAPRPGARARRLRPLVPYALLAPALLVLAAILGFPLYRLVFLSFQQYGLKELFAGRGTFIGLRNYQDILTDPFFWTVVARTLVFATVAVGLTMVLGTLVALLLRNLARPMRVLVTAGLVAAWAMPTLTAISIWQWMFDFEFGVVNWLLTRLGAESFQQHNWFDQPLQGFTVIMIVVVWGALPFVAITLHAGLTQVPAELEEAARVDGAGFWRRMFEVTIPLTLPVVAVAALFGAILTFTDMTVVYVLTRGGPTNSTQVLASWAFIRGIEGGDIAQGAAVALFLFPLLLAAAIAILRAVRRMEVL